ncbi:MAG TPA: dihydropteroate synthase [Pirellulales bacterium]|nr:dihydropteroate synthase [Pirellulales bacterium]
MRENRVLDWQLKTRRLAFLARPLVMGILNVTPDSFSDGGRFDETAAAVTHGMHMAAWGAELIDVGGESTRPYSQPVDEAEEMRRVLPVVQALAERTDVPISIDTSKAAVAREAVAAGAEIINDVTALAGDARMIETAIETGAAVCAMHMLGTPQTMQDNPIYDDVVAEVFDYLRRRRDALVEAGIAPQKIALDPGIGFGKTHEHNLTLLANCRRFHELGCPLLVGHSRKGFIGKIIGDKMADRTAGGIGVSISLANQGVQIVRVHDVEPTLHALKLYVATGGLGIVK